MDIDEESARLEATLDAYRRIIERLVRIDWDLEHYKAAADLFLHLQQEATRLPGVQAEWLEVLISRFEFTHALWETRHATKGTESLEACQAKHLGALARLHSGCTGRPLDA